MTDLFTTSPEDWADEIYIVAPGSTADVSLIPDNAITLALNDGIDLIKYWDIWMVADSDYAKTVTEDRASYALNLIMSETANENTGNLADYTFKQDPVGFGVQLPNTLRCGSTVLGCALQFCIHMEIKPYIIGADMGKTYYDGSPTHGQFHRMVHRQATWFHILRGMGLDPVVLTPSPLEDL